MANIMRMCTSRIHLLMERDKDFPQALRERLILESGRLENPLKLNLLSGFLSSGVLCDGSNDSEAINDILNNLMDNAITIASSKGTEGTKALVKALEDGGNPTLIFRLRKWLHHQSRLRLFRTTAPKKEIEKVASFNCGSESGRKGKLLFTFLFNKRRLVAQLPDAEVKVWNWREEKLEKTIILQGLYEDMTHLLYNEETIVLGTASGRLHLFDTKTLEEKCSVRLAEPVRSLHFVQSSSSTTTTTLVAHTQAFTGEKLWRLDLGSDMRLGEKKPLATKEQLEKLKGFTLDSIYIFMLDQTCVRVYSTETGRPIMDAAGAGCSLESPAAINSFKLLDLISAKRVAMAGCVNGLIAMWTTDKLSEGQRPIKTIGGQMKDPVVSLCPLKGHLLSLDGAGKLLMWSGYDLENENIGLRTTFPRILAENWEGVSIVESCQRWFATNSARDDVINVWTLPDLWLRCG